MSNKTNQTNNEEEYEFVDLTHLEAARLKLAMATIAYYAFERGYLDQADEPDKVFSVVDAEEEFLALVDPERCGPNGRAAASIMDRN